MSEFKVLVVAATYMVKLNDVFCIMKRVHCVRIASLFYNFKHLHLLISLNRKAVKYFNSKIVPAFRKISLM